MKKKQWKRLLAMLLAVLMCVGWMPTSYQAEAQDTETVESAAEAETGQAESVQKEEIETPESVPEVKTEQPERVQESEQKEKADQPESTSEAKADIPKSTPEVKEETKEAEPQPSEAAGDVSAYAADYTAPLIESITLEPQDTVTSLDTPVKVTVKSSDIGGKGVNYVGIAMDCLKEDGSWEQMWSDSKWSSEEEDVSTCEFTYDLNNGCGKECVISRVKVVDKAGNVAWGDVESAEEGYLYKLQVEETLLEREAPVITSLDIQEKEVKQNESIHIRLGFENLKGHGVRSAAGVFQNVETQETIEQSFWANGTEDENSISMSSTIYQGYFAIGTWKVTAVKITDDMYHVTELPLEGELAENAFQVIEGEQTETPETPDILKNPTYTVEDKEGKNKPWKNGMTLEIGDKLKVSCAIKEGNNVTEGSGHLELQHFLSNVETFLDIPLTYADGTFTGTLEITEDCYPCEWGVEYARVYWGEEPTSYSYFDSNDYFYITQEGRISVPYDATFYPQYMNEEGRETSGEEVQVSDIVRHTKVSEVGALMEELRAIESLPGYEGCKIIGWETSDGVSIEKAEVLSDDSFFTIHAVYDKAVTRIKYSYLDKALTTQEANMVQVTPIDPTKPMTYAELLDSDSVKQVLTAKAEEYLPEGFTFKGWSTRNNTEDHLASAVEGVTTLVLEPMYDKTVANISYYCLDKEGMQVWSSARSTFPLETDPVMTYRKLVDLIAQELTGTVAASMPEGMTFQGFKAMNMSSEELDAPVEGLPYLNLIAQYDTRAVKIGYSYFDETGTWVHTGGELKLVDLTKTYGEIIQELQPSMAQQGQELIFDQWTMEYGDISWEEVPEDSGLQMELSASYKDKTVVVGTLSYNQDTTQDATQDVNAEKAFAQVIPNGMTYREFAGTYCTVTHYPGLGFEKWERFYNEELGEDVIPQGTQYLSLTAVYQNSLVKVSFHGYFNEQGENVSSNGYVYEVVPKGETYAEFCNRYTTDIKGYEGLRIKRWNLIGNYNPGDEVQEGSWLSIEPEYENCMVRFIIYQKPTLQVLAAAPTRYKKCFVVEKGGKLTAPKVPAGYEKFTWRGYVSMSGGPGSYLEVKPDQEITMTNHCDFYPAFPSKPSPGNPEVPAAVKVTGVKLDRTAADLTAEGASVNLKASVTPKNATNQAIIWSSSDANVASVNNGTVTAVSNGTATITATTKDGNFTASCKVTVKIPPKVIRVTGVTLNKSSLAFSAENETAELQASIAPKNASNQNITWKSSNKGVVKVAENGVVTAVFNGTAKITATTVDGQHKAVCEVTVKIPPKVIPEEKIEEVKNQIGTAAPGESIVVDMGEATVISKDILTAAKENHVDVVLDMGGYTWTIKSEDISDANLEDINLQVRTVEKTIPDSLIESFTGGGEYVQQISLTHEGNFGFKADLTIKLDPQYVGKYGNLYYKDSADKLVFMNAGIIDGDGNVKLGFSHASEYLVVVNDAPGKVRVESVTIDRTSLELKTAGETAVLNAVVAPENAADKTVNWRSSDEAVATVLDGVVTAVGNGTAAITAVTNDGAFEASCMVTVSIEAAAPDPTPGDSNGGETLSKDTTPDVAGANTAVTSAVKTGDDSNVLFVTILGAVSLLGIAAVLISFRKRRKA